MPSDICESDRAFPEMETTESEGATGRSATATDRATTPSRDDRFDDRDGRFDDCNDRFDERLRAVERALTGSDTAVSDLADGATATEERRAIESRLGDIEARVEELEAATQALRGYAGAVRAVNREVERRADLALARASDGSDRGVAPRGAGSDSERAAGPIDEVPSDSALDAAVPSDRGPETPGGVGKRGEEVADKRNERVEGDDATDDRSWRSGTLERLRESL
ncbi:MAG: DUF7310 family coiled-coil domain-containing protein [Halorubrum sp.]